MKRTDKSRGRFLRLLLVIMSLLCGGFFVQVGSGLLGKIYEFEALGYWDAYQVFAVMVIIFANIALTIGAIIGD